MQYSRHLSEGRTAFAAGASSQAPKKGEKTGNARSKEPEIVVLNTAADVVKGWLEAEGGSEGEEDAPPEPEARPPRLGLGAKYLPHAKVSSNLGTLEKRLRAKIETSARQGSGEEAETHGPSRKKTRVEGNTRDGSNGANVLEKESDPGSDDDEEEERGGRGGAFQKKQRGLPAFEVTHSKKAKKKKKKKRDEVG